MRVRTTFPRRTRLIEHAWIPLADGCRLAARIWLPEDAEDDPVPAVLEYIPYRKRDATATRDALIHPYFAGHGYASVRVDIRGSGDSDGILEDEYLPQELEDGAEVVAWLANQSWCSGAVGMIGKSWGGFNALQIAALRPPALKAVISVCSTDDRYADDVHYMGGCVLASDMLAWAATMLAYNARPPDPNVVGEAWREQWLERMDRTPPFIESWLSHQRRDAFWRHGSVCEDYDAIECPVYMVGGWADGYSNAIPRFLTGYHGPRRGLIGPWAHSYPHEGLPGPPIGFLQECVRWWDQWLKGRDTGVMDEPILRVWMQEWEEPPAGRGAERPGRWVSEPVWPPADERAPLVLHLDGTELARDPGTDGDRVLSGPQSTGSCSGVWCGWGRPEDVPLDQRPDDGLSLAFLSAPLDDRVEILGFPEAVLTLATDQPLANVAVRLCDIAPHGSSLLVSRGFLNLAHRESHEHPERLEPGRFYEMRVRLDAIAYAFPAGHRIGLSVSSAYWPFLWPGPAPVTLTLATGPSRLELPVRVPRPEDEALVPFDDPEVPRPLEVVARAPESGRIEIHRDVATGRQDLVWDNVFFAGTRFPDGLVYDERSTNSYSILDEDPLTATVTAEWQIEIGRDGWQTSVETRSVMSADADSFLLTNVLDAYEHGRRVFSKTWSKTIPRDHV
jgi:putative CocE/NonD family hydrolase